MSAKTTIVDITPKNIDEYKPTCFLNVKNIGAITKNEWMKKQFKNGLRTKLLFPEEGKKYIGMIEYLPGENAWRAVDAKDYYFIHCLWIDKKNNRNQGLGSELVQEVINDAKKEKKTGVAAITSNDAFMAEKDIFVKNGFEVVDESGAYTLLALNFKKGEKPAFKDWEKQLSKYNNLTIVYANQCPWVARSIEEIKEYRDKENIPITIKELTTPKQAQNAPSIYGVFNLVYKGKLLIDHYVSLTRFKNILKKELK